MTGGGDRDQDIGFSVIAHIAHFFTPNVEVNITKTHEHVTVYHVVTLHLHQEEKENHQAERYHERISYYRKLFEYPFPRRNCWMFSFRANELLMRKCGNPEYYHHVYVVHYMIHDILLELVKHPHLDNSLGH